jgi:hypothetical protein
MRIHLVSALRFVKRAERLKQHRYHFTPKLLFQHVTFTLPQTSMCGRKTACSRFEKNPFAPGAAC